MNTNKKWDLKANIDKTEFLNENYECLYKKLIFNPLFRVCLLFVLFIISIIFNKRIDKLSEITSVAIFGNKSVLTFASYFVILILTMVGCLTISIGAFLIKRKFKEANINLLKRSYLIYNIYDMLVFLVSSILVILFTIMVVVTPCNISGDSMNYTYLDKDKVLIWNLFYKVDNNDVIVFDSKNYVNNGKDESRFYIKRVVAKEGDLIQYDAESKDLYINYIYIEEIDEIEFNRILKSIDLKDITEFVVPKNKVLVFGDNRSNSIDSRIFGFIDESDVIGKVILRIAPLSDFGNPEPNIKK